MINIDKIVKSMREFRNNKPFDHCVVDGFFEPEMATKLEKEFIPYNSDSLFIYDNAIENKKALNDWNKYPENTYNVLSYLISNEFVKVLESLGFSLYSDPGLHGGGWHIHGAGGNLNPHLDYHIHPKLKKVRKLNIIIYLSSDLNYKDHGGHLGLWDHDEKNNAPGKLITEIEPVFNRAVLFDTTQNSWHGMSRTLNVPDGIYRKSLAIYYLTDPKISDFDGRQKALFAARPEQKGQQYVEETIRQRADSKSFMNVYRSNISKTD